VDRSSPRYNQLHRALPMAQKVVQEEEEYRELVNDNCRKNVPKTWEACEVGRILWHHEDEWSSDLSLGNTTSFP